MEIKQMSRKDLMKLGTLEAQAELKVRLERVQADMAVIRKIRAGE